MFTTTVVEDRGRMAQRVSALGASLVVVDTAVIPNLELLPQALVLVLRETISSRLAAFRLPGGRLWDEVLLAAPSSEWQIPAEAVGARAVTNVGWIYRTASSASGNVLDHDAGRKTILVATGGGGNEETAAAVVRELAPVVDLVRAWLSAERVRVLQVAGPRAPSCAMLPNADAVIDVGSRLDEAFGEADLVISTTGYNSVLELATCNTPALLIAIARTYDDQEARARLWGPKVGLNHREGDPIRSARWIANTLTSSRRRAFVDLGPSGCETAARRLAARLDGAASADSRRHFVKRSPPSGPSVDLTMRRSHALLAGGVPTCPGVADASSDAIAFARLEGETAFDVWRSIRRDGLDRQASGFVEFFAHVLQPLAKLHQASSCGLELAPLDVLRRIAPRLEKPASSLPEGVSDLLEALTGAISARTRMSRRLVVHGDFHFRQLIRPTGRTDFVLVDLDDLATGPAESDLGNCLAHLATSDDWNARAVAPFIQGLVPQLVARYAHVSQFELDRNAIALFAAIALIRRALKLAERGLEAERVGLVIDGAAVLAGSVATSVRHGRQTAYSIGQPAMRETVSP